MYRLVILITYLTIITGKCYYSNAKFGYQAEWAYDQVLQMIEFNITGRVFDKQGAALWTGIGLSRNGELENSDWIIVTVGQNRTPAVIDSWIPNAYVQLQLQMQRQQPISAPIRDRILQDVSLMSVVVSNDFATFRVRRAPQTIDLLNDVSLGSGANLSVNCAFMLFPVTGGPVLPDSTIAAQPGTDLAPVSTGIPICLSSCLESLVLSPGASASEPTATSSVSQSRATTTMSGTSASLQPVPRLPDRGCPACKYGRCTNGTCSCDNGWAGHLCDSAIRTSQVCEGSRALVWCPIGQLVTVLTGFYGRRRASECAPKPWFQLVTPCSLSTALQTVLAACANHSWCSVPANNQNFGADPCVFYKKEVVVTWFCSYEAHWTAWAPWTACSAACNGTRSRSRQCMVDRKLSLNCHRDQKSFSEVHKQLCNEQACSSSSKQPLTSSTRPSRTTTQWTERPEVSAASGRATNEQRSSEVELKQTEKSDVTQRTVIGSEKAGSTPLAPTAGGTPAADLAPPVAPLARSSPLPSASPLQAKPSPSARNSANNATRLTGASAHYKQDLFMHSRLDGLCTDGDNSARVIDTFVMDSQRALRQCSYQCAQYPQCAGISVTKISGASQCTILKQVCSEPEFSVPPDATYRKLSPAGMTCWTAMCRNCSIQMDARRMVYECQTAETDPSLVGTSYNQESYLNCGELCAQTPACRSFQYGPAQAPFNIVESPSYLPCYLFGSDFCFNVIDSDQGIFCTSAYFSNIERTVRRSSRRAT